MADAWITAAGESDPDNPLLTDGKLARVRLARRLQAAGARTGLNWHRFAEAYRINVGRLLDLNTGRTQQDSAVSAYLTVTEREPEAVETGIARGGDLFGKG